MFVSKTNVERAVTRISISLPDNLWQEIVAYQNGQMLATTAEAIRRLILTGLAIDPPIKPRTPQP